MPFVARFGLLLAVLVFPAPMSIFFFFLLLFFAAFIAFRVSVALFGFSLLYMSITLNRSRVEANERKWK